MHSTLPVTLTLRHALGVVSVTTDADGVEAELRERLTPYFSVTAGPAPAAPDLAIAARHADDACPVEPPGEVMIRFHPQFERYRRPADFWERPEGYVMRERKNGSVFRWSRDRAAVGVANADARSLAKSTRRLVQDFLRLRVWHAGGIVVEASTVAVGGVALLTVGGSGAGKTTLLARVLADGGAMVSNDEVGLCASGGEVVAYGLPVQINVRPPLMERFPQLADLADFLEGPERKAPVRYDAFARALGGSVVASAGDLVGILLEPEAEPAADVAPEAFAAHLLAHLESGPGWTSPWRLLAPGYAEPSSDEAARRAAPIAMRLPALSVGRQSATRHIVDAARSRRSSG